MCRSIKTTRPLEGDGCGADDDGDVQFDLITYFDGFDSQFSVDYAEHPLIEGKPRLQFVADKLDEIRIQLSFHFHYCDPEAELAKLKKALATHEAMAMVLGNGDYKGWFVLTDVQAISKQTDPGGTLIALEATITLREFVGDKKNPTKPPAVQPKQPPADTKSLPASQTAGITTLASGAMAKYHDPKTKKLVVYGMKGDQVTQVGQTTASAKKQSGQSTSGDTLKLSSRGSKAAVQVKTQAALDNVNFQQTAGNLTVPGNTKLVAGVTFELADCGKLSGKYLLESARHRMDRGGGYTTELEVKRVALPVTSGTSGTTAKKKFGKTLKVYGIQSNDQVGVVGTTQASKKK